MKPTDPLLDGIAREHLLIPTLESRRADSLDFHDVAVWQVEAALKAAFDAGVQSAGKKANARMASSAPRLLESLVACANLLADYDESDGPEGDAYREAVAAITEATGRAA